MRQIKTENYEIASFDTREPYFEILTKIYGKASIANALDNTYEFTIDPITKEILIDLNLPTDIVNLMIYAVKLLADKQYTWELNEGLYRVRSAEIIPAILYDALAKNYITYKNSNGKKKFSVPRDIVIKHLLELKTVEDYSTLNPILELERWHTISSKGWRGINLADSYTIEKRSYDPSMIGIIGTASSPDAQVGVSRTLTLEPKIKSARGYVEITDPKDIDKLKDVNLFSPGELSIPLGATRDDAIRLGHALKQSKHVIPVTNSSPVLISTGMEEAVRFNLSTDFVVNAKDNGKVIDFDEKSQIMIVEYSNGEHQAINLAPVIVKNGGGGFYESNKLTTNLKVGSRFKVNDPLAWNKDFFHNDSLNGCRMNMGTLAKVAIMSTYNTYEDATFITEKLSKDAASEMTFKKPVVLGKNSNVLQMVKVGDHIDIGDSLIQFDSSFDDESLNQFLSSLSSDPRLEKEIMDSLARLGYAFCFETLKDTVRGSCYAGSKNIVLNPVFSNDVLASTLVHEAEHALQSERLGEYDFSNLTMAETISKRRAKEADACACQALFAWQLKDVAPKVYDEARTNETMKAFISEMVLSGDERRAMGAAFKEWYGVNALWYEKKYADSLKNDAQRAIKRRDNGVFSEKCPDGMIWKACAYQGKPYIEAEFLNSREATALPDEIKRELLDEARNVAREFGTAPDLSLASAYSREALQERRKLIGQLWFSHASFEQTAYAEAFMDELAKGEDFKKHLDCLKEPFIYFERSDKRIDYLENCNALMIDPSDMAAAAADFRKRSEAIRRAALST